MKKRIKIKKIGLILLIVLIISIGCGSLLFINVHGLSSKIKIKLNGKNNETIEVLKDYKDKGITATYDNKKISNIKTSGKVNTKKIGDYTLTYIAKYKKVSKKVKRVVKVVDKTSPTITLTGEAVDIQVGNEFVDPGYKAEDNYDGDITSKVETNNNIDINTIGTYEVNYKVVDSSKNEATAKRVVNVIAKPVIPTRAGVAVLNYHFFYNSAVESCSGGSNCIDINNFRQQLNYLRDNGYKTLTMTEFRDYMYGRIDVPAKSVLITVDDGGMGTGKQNGNYLAPILEEYKMHATLFLITGWWDINNYNGSKYLEIESHTNDMHNEGWCQGVTRGARMLCQTNEEVLTDLKKSIDIIGSKKAFCFPFYAYDDRTIELVKQAGFELAFIGGGYKANRNQDKWHVPRYQILKNTSLDTFANYVS